MSSLKSFLPVLADILVTTPDTLYSRQRALVDLGLLESKPGRGPGSGVELSMDSVGVMLIACLCADTLADTDRRVAAICSAKRAGSKKQETFREGMAAALAETPDAPEPTKIIRVARCWRAEHVVGQNNTSIVYNVRLEDREHGQGWRPIGALAEIQDGTIHRIGIEVQQALKEGD
jgi:hypothetical protein